MDATKHPDWKSLLQAMSSTIYNKVEENMTYYDRASITDEWLGFEGASLRSIEDAEKKLGMMLPPSYRDFLLTSNGFRQISHFAGELCAVADIDWTKNKDPEFIQILSEVDVAVTDEEYYVYGEEQRSENFRFEFLKATLQISEWVDGSVVLLNPLVRFGEEWEAWVYANWHPGAHRYRSFRELMEEEYLGTVKLLENRD
jgi:hypothetical protein